MRHSGDHAACGMSAAPVHGYAIWRAEYLGCKQKLSQAVNDNLGLEDT